MNKHYLNLVAGYEAKQIRRSFIFWVLLLITVVGMNVLQCLLQSDRFMIPSKWSWLMHGQSFSFPLVNAYLYNLVQSFIVLFVATDIFTREQTQGPRESLITRPVDNGEYLLGKAWGIVRVFVTLAIVSIAICCGVQLLSSTAPFNPGYYLFYFLTLTLPSLLYITGLSFFLTWLTRSRMLTILLLLVYWGFTIALLPNVFHGLFDFTGSTLSNVFSAVTGHVDGMNYLLHRLMYLLLGLGFIFGTIRLQKRLPNERKKIACWSALGGTLLLVGVLSGGIYARGFLAEREVREAYRAAFARHAKMASGRVSRHAITFEQQGDRVTSKSELTYRNPNATPLSRLLLFLNPGLEVTKLEADGQPLKYERDGQIVAIERTLNPGDSVRLTMHYAGKIDERVAYLDIEDTDYYNTERGDNFFHLGRRHALVSDEAVVLIPEVMWYPMAVAPVHLVSPALTEHDYTLYRLTVNHPKQPTVLSQGAKRQTGNVVEFHPYLPLEGITLCAGEYEQKTVNLNGVQVNWYHFKGNDFFTSIIPEQDQSKVRVKIAEDMQEGRLANVTSSGGMMIDASVRAIGGSALQGKKEKEEIRLADVIMRRDWCNDQEQQLQIVETPIPFTSHFRIWKGKSEYVQPGMILMGERAMGMDLRGYYGNLHAERLKKLHEKKYRVSFQNNSSWQPDSATQERWRIGELARLFMDCFLQSVRYYSDVNPFLNKVGFKTATSYRRFSNPLLSASLFFEPAVVLTSDRYKMIDKILKNIFIKGDGGFRGISAGDSYFSLNDKNMMAAYMYLQNHSFEEAVLDKRLSSAVFNEVMNIKTNLLLKWIGTRTTQKEFYRCLRSFYLSRHGEVPLDTLSATIQTELGFDFEQVLQAWDTKDVTAFRFMNVKSERIDREYLKRGGATYMHRFQVQNAGDKQGVIFYDSEIGIVQSTLNYLVLQPGECKEVNVANASNVLNVSCGIARNMPSAIRIEAKMKFEQRGVGGFIDKSNTSSTRDTVQSIKNISPMHFSTDPNEIIVDNEDQGFRLITPEKKLLQKLFAKEVNNFWQPNQWTKVYESMYYGDFVKGGYVKMGKKGENKGEYKAEWSADILQEGTYEIFVKAAVGMWHMFHAKGQYYTVSGQGVEETEILVPLLEEWNSLGKFRLQPGKSFVVLDDRIPEEEKPKKGEFVYASKQIIADAVKWVRVE